MKTIEDAVIYHKGVWPSKNTNEFILVVKMKGNTFVEEHAIIKNNCHYGYDWQLVCTYEQFESTAKRMGFIGKYRWGVEYPTNGKRPDLADDVEICVILSDSSINGLKISNLDWSDRFLFKITDQRYKPADTSYLNSQPEGHIDDASKMADNWHERGELPPVGVECEVYFDTDHSPEWHRGTVTYRSDKFTVIIYDDGDERCYELEELEDAKFRPIRTHREKVIEAAMAVGTLSGPGAAGVYGGLYDAGMLVLPQEGEENDA